MARLSSHWISHFISKLASRMAYLLLFIRCNDALHITNSHRKKSHKKKLTHNVTDYKHFVLQEISQFQRQIVLYSLPSTKELKFKQTKITDIKSLIDSQSNILSAHLVEQYAAHFTTYTIPNKQINHSCIHAIDIYIHKYQ